MPVIRIHDLDDPRLAPFRQLKETNATRREGLFVTEGDKLLERLLASAFDVVSILLDERQYARFEPLLPVDTPTYVIPGELVESLVGFNFHRGALACGRRKPPETVGEFLSRTGGDVARPLRLVIGCEVQNPENVGALLRLCAAFAVDALALGPGCADPLSRRVLRVSMGAALRVPVLITNDLEADLGLLRQHGVASIATVLDPIAVPLAQAERPARAALLFGSEGHGLPTNIVAACSQQVWIPMAAGTDSLNVAMAAGIVLYGWGGW